MSAWKLRAEFVRIHIAENAIAEWFDVASPKMVRELLETYMFRRIDEPENGSVWERDEHIVLVPDLRTMGDWRTRMGEIIHALRKIERIDR